MIRLHSFVSDDEAGIGICEATSMSPCAASFSSEIIAEFVSESKIKF